MDAEYDVNMLSTSLNECILRGLLSIDDLKVLHMDRNEYYGEESTSLNLNKLWTRFRGNDKLLPYLGASRDYSMDMNPRFSLVNGNLVHVLIHTNITHSLNFNVVDGRYVFTEGKIHKVPTNNMGYLHNVEHTIFFIYVQNYNESDPKTHAGMDLTRVTTQELITKYGLDDNTIDLIGHALALPSDHRYLAQHWTL
ncbi:hypothetical protein JHK86_004306 [Glycine max]|nr:hypothetical protein JHK86_004306 [Glycine max]